MAKIVQTTDFIGKYTITQSSNTITILQAFIEKYEKIYLYDLLGVALGNLLLADISTPFTVPSTLKYSNIFNPISQDTPLIRTNGIKEMLVGFIYFEYCKQSTVKHTITGYVIGDNEVSNQVDINSTPIYGNYNEAVNTFKCIQCYINANSSDYIDFKGTYKCYNSWAI
jgi:hypothetical protein